MTAFQKRSCFVVMLILVFIGENLVGSSSCSTGPHLNLNLPFGWLQLHRYGDTWIIEHFDFRMLIVALLVSILVTWLFSNALRAAAPRLPADLESDPPKP